jgi:23S rRNA (cytosine1962-C5)-methyltransferase
MTYPTIQLKRGREKSADNYHPWIFSGAVEKVEGARHGEIAAVAAYDGRTIGYGLFDKNSQIICRIFHFGVEAFDFSSPEYWFSKFDKAMFLRQNHLISSQTNCYRLIHAEGDGIPGLIVDIYNNNAIVQFLVQGTRSLKDIFFDCLTALGFQKIFVRNEPGDTRGYWVSEPGETMVEIVENGLRYIVDIAQGQKTGFFLDQRENRLIASNMAVDKSVLNLFSYSGGFSVSALKGGASKVVSVDASAAALGLCDRNIELNFPGANHLSVEADCFQYLRQMDEIYDVIIIDPPAFAKNQSAVNKAARGYKDLNMIAIKKIASPGLMFTFSCSQHISRDLFQKILFAAASDAGRPVKILKRLEQPLDHPVNIYHPEGEYLKGLLLWVD